MFQKMSMKMIKEKVKNNPTTKPKHNILHQQVMVISQPSSNFKLNMIQRLNDSVSCGSCGKG